MEESKIESSTNSNVDPDGKEGSDESVLNEVPPNVKPTRETRTIILTGLRGVGRSTLALMALAALKYKYVDVEKCIQEHTGMPEAKYLEKCTQDEYYKLQSSLVIKALKDNSDVNLLIVFPSSYVDNPYLLDYLATKNYPYIINIECDEKRILNYISYKGNVADGINLIQQAFYKYRSVAKYNFYNLFTDLDFIRNNLVCIGEEKKIQMNSPLILKPIEKEFVRFLKFITGGAKSSSAYVCALHLTLDFEKRFTTCFQIEFPKSNSFFPGIEKLIRGSDVIEVKIDLIELIKNNITNINFKIEEFIANVRRYTYCSMPIIVSIANSLSDLSLFILEYSISTTDDYKHIKDNLRNYYLSTIDCVLRLGVEFIAIDLAICVPDQHNFMMQNQEQTFSMLKDIMDLSNNTSIIGYYHSNSNDFWESTDGAVKFAHLASSLTIPILRLSSVANCLSDNFKVLDFKNKINYLIPNLYISAFNEGVLGRPSKVFNKILTPVSCNSSNSSLSNVGSNITAIEVLNALHTCFMIPDLDFYIMGVDVSKSLSPNIHNASYREIGLPHRFKLYQCSSLEPHLSNLVKSPKFGGTAVIMPFKLEALKYVDTISSHVKIIGAINTIVADRTSEEPYKVTQIRGENTDWLGIRTTLLDNITPINAVSKNKTALVLGAGGMSRSVIYTLVQLGYQRILLYNRSYEKGKKLADYYNSLSPIKHSLILTTGEDSNIDDLNYFRIHLLNSEDFQKVKIPDDFSYPTVIVSCIPNSDMTTGELINLNLSSAWFNSPSGGVVLETGYDPLFTPLLNKVARFRHKGWVGLNGLNFLYAQALAQFELFTGKPAPRDLMKSIISKYYNNQS